MSSKSKENNLKQSHSSVDSFELTGDEVLLYLINEDNSEAGELPVSLEEFENWLCANDYLQGHDEECTGYDHDGEPTYSQTNWNYSLDEILNEETRWNTSELLTAFINQKQAA